MRGLLLCAAVVAGLVCASPANADEGAYLNDLHGQPGIIGGVVNDGVYVSQGHRLCDLLASGASPEDAAGQIQNFYVTPYIASAMVAAARRSLCP